MAKKSVIWFAIRTMSRTSMGQIPLCCGPMTPSVQMSRFDLLDRSNLLGDFSTRLFCRPTSKNVPRPTLSTDPNFRKAEILKFSAHHFIACQSLDEIERDCRLIALVLTDREDWH